MSQWRRLNDSFGPERTPNPLELHLQELHNFTKQWPIVMLQLSVI